ncbi:uncharacterized protein LOC111077941 [Drosophila obscura]|uniref:uncharacterized protein LOC111077941 n=1 Tax=Drosophila obscura TaxID=7282 RepID=UPI000B9F9C32|nr:uncharacterized protein LOC111077941 [Drosophila obscura]
MEPSFVIATIIAIFCQQMELCYDPAGYVGLESTLFILISIVALNKLQGYRKSYKTLWETTAEIIFICLTMQVLLVTVWYVAYCSLQAIVEALFNSARSLLSDKHVDKLNTVQPFAWTICMLTVEMAFVFETIQMDGLQLYFGVIDDLPSESVLSIVAEQEAKNERREQRLARQRDRGYSRQPARRSVNRRGPRSKSRASR